MRLPFRLQRIINEIKRQKDQYPPSERLRRWAFLRTNPVILGTKSVSEKQFEAALKEDISRIPFEEPRRASAAENKWIMFKNSIRQHALTEDARTFISWPPVRHNMHYVPSLPELAFVKKNSLWPAFEQALATKSVANIPFFAMPTANENGVRQAFHLANLLEATGVKIEDVGQIFEFGGGYGSMCLLVSRLGFKGRYAIFDWPELSALQKYYLSMERADLSRVRFLNKVSDISSSIDKQCRTLIIGTWSLSECSVELRESIFKEVNPDLYLISYQKRFSNIDNEAYFTQLQASRPDIHWKKVPITYIPSEKNRYIFGVKKAF